jgi:hypothetical protein
MANASIQQNKKFRDNCASAHCERNPWPSKQVAKGSGGHHTDDEKGDISHTKSLGIRVYLSHIMIMSL